MTPDRREFLTVAGGGVTVALAGCVIGSRPALENGTGNGDPRPSLSTYDTSPFSVHTGRLPWHEDGEVGHVTVIDSESRQRAVIDRYELSEERREAICEFLTDLDYGRERLLLVESVGPNACHDRLEIDSLGVEEGELRIEAGVIDTSEDDVACAEVVTYPSTLLRVAFEDDPTDTATAEITDGWGETATISARADDPIGAGLDSLAGYVRPDGEPEPVPALECDRDDVNRHPQGFEEGSLAWGTVDQGGEPTFALRIEHTDYEYGDTARIRLTNVADEQLATGNSAKYNLQAYTESGWADVRVADADRPFAYTDEAVLHSPGEGFEWTIELTESGIEAVSQHDVRVCPELASGRYRFVFWEASGGPAAVSFDLRRS